MHKSPQSPTLVSLAGLGYFPLAMVARLPFAMMVIGVLTLVVAARGSVELGGINSAMVGLGTACVGPLIGAAADRFGQRPTLLLAGAINSVALLLFAWLAYSDLPVWVMFVGAFLVGASAPQASPMSRSRLVALVGELPVERRPRVMSTTMAYESAVDEAIFVFGPVVVGLLATWFGAGAPVIGAAVLTAIFITLFALHRTSAPAKSAEERAATLAPVSELWRPRLLVVVIGIATVGVLFGSTLTGLTSFMKDRGAVEQAGILYGVMGVGSAIFAIAIAMLPPSFTLRLRWPVCAAMILAGTLLLQTAHDIPRLLASLALMGIGIGPLLVTMYSLGALRSPAGRSATVMTMLGSGIVVGQSAASAITGTAAEQAGTSAALVVPLVAAALALAAGIANWFLTPESERRSAH